VAHSINGGDCNNASGTIISQGHNLASDNTCSSFFNQAGDRNSTDPRLDFLADNGGPTQTHALLFGSPAIDAGDDCVLTGCSGNSQIVDTDQRGVARPKGTHVDIGAFEFELVTYVVNATSDHAPGQCNPLGAVTDCTLREAINAANANTSGPSRIAFDIPTGVSGDSAAM